MSVGRFMDECRGCVRLNGQPGRSCGVPNRRVGCLAGRRADGTLYFSATELIIGPLHFTSHPALKVYASTGRRDACSGPRGGRTNPRLVTGDWLGRNAYLGSFGAMSQAVGSMPLTWFRADESVVLTEGAYSCPAIAAMARSTSDPRPGSTRWPRPIRAIWEFQTDQVGELRLQRLGGWDGVLGVGTNLYAIHGNSPLAQSSWPKSRERTEHWAGRIRPMPRASSPNIRAERRGRGGFSLMVLANETRLPRTNGISGNNQSGATGQPTRSVRPR